MAAQYADAVFHFFRQKAQTHRARNAGYLSPLAGRVGMQNFRDELEDLAFAEVNKEGRELINERLDELSKIAAICRSHRL